MRNVDTWTTERYGIPQLELMENAASRVLDVLHHRCGPPATRRFSILCGKGNNGGDGLALGRLLFLQGARPRIFLFARPDDLKDLPRLQLDLLSKAGAAAPVPVCSAEEWNEVRGGIAESDCIVDALLGTGITQPLQGLLLKVVEDVNGMRAPVVAVDVPSGLLSDDIARTVTCVHADATVTFTAPKPGMLLSPNCEAVGEMLTVSIGSPPELVDQAGSALALSEACLVEPFVRRRVPFAHKGDFGRVLVVAGSRGKSGAAILAGLAALRSGAGTVTIAVPAAIQDAVMAAAPAELMTEGLADEARGFLSAAAAEQALRLADACDAVAVGPGLGTDPSTVRAVRDLVQGSPVPVVVDADALNAMASSASSWRPKADWILTPHLGEMARLIRRTPQEVFENRLQLGVEFARVHGCELVLKGYRTLTVSAAGDVWVNSTGNPGMATAGSGDVLTGVIAALIARNQKQHLATTHDAVAAAVYLHGAAGDAAEGRVGQESLMAGDIIDGLAAACMSIRGRGTDGILGKRKVGN